MRKRLVITTFMLTAVIFAVSAIQEEEKEIPKKFAFETSRGTVEFPHVLHHCLENVVCKTCHHNLANDRAVPEKKCHDCHTSDSDVTSQDAFHKSCRDCHRAFKKEHKDSKAPTSCSKCHIKSE